MLLWDEDEEGTILFHSVIFNSVVVTYWWHPLEVVLRWLNRRLELLYTCVPFHTVWFRLLNVTVYQNTIVGWAEAGGEQGQGADRSGEGKAGSHTHTHTCLNTSNLDPESEFWPNFDPDPDTGFLLSILKEKFKNNFRENDFLIFLT